MLTCKIGTRGSELARVQANSVLEALSQHRPEFRFELVVIQTEGDLNQHQPLHQMGGDGLFIKAIEAALLDGSIDLAVHSMKDLPSLIPEGLSIAAATKRQDARDALVSRGVKRIGDLPKGARVATGSLRRRSQLLSLRPDLQIEELRGNVNTRLSKFDNSDWSAMVLASAGLKRLGKSERITAPIPVSSMLPAAGQGALGIETRSDDEQTRKLVAILNDPETERATTAERAFLRRLQGGCQVPIAAHAHTQGEQLELHGFVGSIDGTKVLRGDIAGDPQQAASLGHDLAGTLIDDGAAELVGHND